MTLVTLPDLHWRVNNGLGHPVTDFGMTGCAEVFRSGIQKLRLVGSMWVVAARTLACFDRLVLMGFQAPFGSFVVAACAHACLRINE